jgi:ATP-dependent Clp protease adaptor protein ClpS
VKSSAKSSDLTIICLGTVSGVRLLYSEPPDVYEEDIVVSVETIEQRSTARKLAPRYRVLLHNDDYNPMEYVVQVLMTTVPSLTQPQAVNIMMEAHTNGLALVITCAQEHAEFYCETLKTHGLSSTIEPDE